MEEKRVLDKLRELRKSNLSFEDGRILSSVSTKPTDISLEAYKIFSDVNALDTSIFPVIESMEKEVIGWFGKLLRNENISGYITTGGTEANIFALWTAKKKNPGKKKILVPETAHYSIEKAADLMSLEIDWIPVDKEYKVSLSKLEKRLTDDTLAVVATAGTSALGVIDPIEELNELCSDVFFHVDAAFAGFVLPFIEDAERIDFSLANIDSVTIDPHKMGYTPIPSGCVLFRDESYMNAVKITPSYLPFHTSQLTGSRSGGHIAATWANIKYLGMDGYRKKVKECMENTELLCKLLEDVEGVNPIVEPEINFLALEGRSIKEIHEGLIKRGWNILLDRDTGTIRIVVMPHVTSKVIKNFISDLKDIAESLI